MIDAWWIENLEVSFWQAKLAVIFKNGYASCPSAKLGSELENAARPVVK